MQKFLLIQIHLFLLVFSFSCLGDYVDLFFLFLVSWQLKYYIFFVFVLYNACTVFKLVYFRYFYHLSVFLK